MLATYVVLIRVVGNHKFNFDITWNLTVELLEWIKMVNTNEKNHNSSV